MTYTCEGVLLKTSIKLKITALNIVYSPKGSIVLYQMHEEPWVFLSRPFSLCDIAECLCRNAKNKYSDYEGIRGRTKCLHQKSLSLLILVCYLLSHIVNENEVNWAIALKEGSENVLFIYFFNILKPSVAYGESTDLGVKRFMSLC